MDIVQGSLQKRFARDILAYMPSKVLPLLTGFITAPIITRLILPAEYGNWSLASGVADFLFAFACSGIAAGGFRYFPAYKQKEKTGVFFTNLFALTGAVVSFFCLVGCAILLLMRPHLSKDLYPLLWIALPIFAAQSFFSVFAEVARSQGKSRLYTALNIAVNYGALAIGILFLVVLDWGSRGLLLGTLIATAAIVPVVFHYTLDGVKVLPKNFSSTDLSSLWKYAWPLSLGNMAYWWLRISDRYVIGAFRPATEVGIYSAVYNLSDKTITVLVSLLILGIGPIIITTWEKQGREATEKTLATLTRNFLLLCLPATVGLTILASPFISIFTGEAYHEGYHIVGYVAFSIFAYGLSRLGGYGLLVNNQTRKYAVPQILAALLNLGLNLVLVPRFGYFVAAVTTLIGYLLQLFLLAFLSQRYLSWQFPRRMVLNILLATLLMGLVVFGLSSIGPQDDGIHIVRVLGSILAGVVIYFGALLLLGEVNEEEKTWFGQVIQRFRRQPR